MSQEDVAGAVGPVGHCENEDGLSYIYENAGFMSVYKRSSCHYFHLFLALHMTGHGGGYSKIGNEKNWWSNL